MVSRDGASAHLKMLPKEEKELHPAPSHQGVPTAILQAPKQNSRELHTPESRFHFTWKQTN